MYRWFVALVLVMGLVGCGDDGKGVKPSTPTMPAHNYIVKDGMKYGYPAAISENDKKAGQVAEKMVMAMYAGERGGKHQVHILDGTTVTAIECSSPCSYIKTMTYIDNPYLKNTINTEHINASPKSLGFMIMQDAMSGALRQYAREINNKRYSMWVDEQKGMQRFLMN